MINGITQIVMTKADILDKLEKLEVCNAYKIDNNEVKEIPFQMNGLNIEPVYKSFDGWNTDITSVNSFGDMPEKMGAYINYINDYLKVPVKYISNGPGREQLVKV